MKLQRALVTSLSITALAAGSLASPAPAPAATLSTLWSATATHALPLAIDKGVIAGTTPLHIAVAMKGNLAGANAMLKHVYTKGDPLYHQYLKPAQFTAEFAPSAAQTAAVEAYLVSQGMKNVAVTPNRLLVTADTTAAGASKAFNTSIHATLQLGRASFANVLPAEVPASLAPAVSSVLGLDNFQMQTFQRRMPQADLVKFFGTATPKVRTFAQAKASSSSAVAPGCNDYASLINGELGVNVVTTPSQVETAAPFCYPAQYTPIQYRVAYNDFGQGSASNTSIADFTEGATNLPYGQGSLKDVVSDLYQMMVSNGIPESPVIIRQVGAVTTDTSGETEWDIDSQAAFGIAGGVKSYYFYNGSDLSTESMNEMFSAFATDDVAQIGNASFGGCEDLSYLEGGFASTDLILAETALQGQTITVSSGDSAAEGCPGIANGTPVGVPSVEYPASSPYAFAVGGTSLLSSSTNGTYYSETTWCGVSCGGGGGPSHFEPQSPWQSLLETSLLGQGVAAGTRLVPDVAMNADPYSGLVMYSSGVLQAGWGGTSLAAPLAEGVFARLMTRHNNSLGEAGAALYQNYINVGGGLTDGIGNNGNFATPPSPNGLTPAVIYGLNDVFLGTNTVFEATPGFDLNTGMGSFNIAASWAAFGN